tara:strand:- start:183 stop:692 length:510 start_codon:yes stop_codon:yes gene_type:complete
MKKITKSKNNTFLKCLLSVLIFLGIYFLPHKVNAEISNTEINGDNLLASSEFLRDLDYETWQLVVYQSPLNNGNLVLRVIGYPGSLRIDHPLSLNIDSGRKNWLLEDITVSNSYLLNDNRQAAVEYDLDPLITSISQNRPLRLSLAGVFSEMPVPPYLVKEWRSLKKNL